jgi:hypothetical protein
MEPAGSLPHLQEPATCPYPYIIIIIIIIIIIYFHCKWVCTRWQWYCSKTHHTK